MKNQSLLIFAALTAIFFLSGTAVGQIPLPVIPGTGSSEVSADFPAETTVPEWIQTQEVIQIMQTEIVQTQESIAVMQTQEAWKMTLEAVNAEQTRVAQTQAAISATQTQAAAPTKIPTKTPVPTKTPAKVPTNTPTKIPTKTSIPKPTSTPKPSYYVGQSVWFGHYEQDNNLSNGQETIEWQILAIENNRALLISKYVLDSKAYQEDRNGITWERSSLRNWLNENFYYSAFSRDEQKRIADTRNSNPDNSRFSAGKGGNSTTDRIFLLSIDEANRYFRSNYDRQCKLTAYAYARGGTYSINSSGYGWWWLRSAGQNTISAADVLPDGAINYEGYWTDDSTVGVRPAFWLDL